MGRHEVLGRPSTHRGRFRECIRTASQARDDILARALLLVDALDEMECKVWGWGWGRGRCQWWVQDREGSVLCARARL